MPRLVVNSEFFLDLADWQTLRQQILPQLLALRPALRAWSAGCHTGKEAYSLAILLDELAPRQAHYILATDKNAELINRARAGGPFTARDVDRIAPNLRQHYFAQAEPPYFVAQRLKQNLTFRAHDLLVDAFETDFDIILYRNVEPFFTPAVNNSLHRKFSRALREGGILFIGATDSLPEWRSLGYVRHSHTLYCRTQERYGS